MLQCTGCRFDNFESDGDGSNLDSSIESQSSQVHSFENPTGLFAGTPNTFCAIDGNDVKCWIFSSQTKDVVAGATLDNPSKVGVSSGVICAIDDTGLSCWKGTEGVALERELAILDVPVLVNPVDIAVSFDHACAIDDSGLTCWGSNAFGNTDVPASMQDASSVVTGTTFTCALKGQDIQCWGYGDNGQLDAPTELSNPRGIANPGVDNTCIIHDDGVECWGPLADAIGVRSFDSPNSVSTGRDHFCVADDGDVECWSPFSNGYVDVPASLGNVDTVAINWLTSCALSSGEGITCWGDF